MSMTPKENVMEVIHWGNPEYVPMTYECTNISGMSTAYDLLENPMTGGKKDCYGVPWTGTTDGTLPDNRFPILSDITQWRDVIHIPDAEEYKDEIFARAKEEEKTYDRDQKLTDLYFPVGLFERLVSFMNFEDTFVALIEEPDVCQELLEAVTKFKLDCLDILIEAHKPDSVTYFDDMCTARGPFISLDTYREIFKPFHAQILKRIQDHGLICKEHICGKAESLLDDFVEMGVEVFNVAQSMNDIPAIQKKFKGQLVIEGGWDSSGPCSYLDASAEDVCAEVRRCMQEYAPGGGYILFPIIMNEKGNSVIVGDPRMPDLMEEYEKWKYKFTAGSSPA